MVLLQNNFWKKFPQNSLFIWAGLWSPTLHRSYSWQSDERESKQVAFWKTIQPGVTFNTSLVWLGEYFRFPELHNCALYTLLCASDRKGVCLPRIPLTASGNRLLAHRGGETFWTTVYWGPQQHLEVKGWVETELSPWHVILGVLCDHSVLVLLSVEGEWICSPVRWWWWLDTFVKSLAKCLVSSEVQKKSTSILRCIPFSLHITAMPCKFSRSSVSTRSM